MIPGRVSCLSRCEVRKRVRKQEAGRFAALRRRDRNVRGGEPVEERVRDAERALLVLEVMAQVVLSDPASEGRDGPERHVRDVVNPLVVKQPEQVPEDDRCREVAVAARCERGARAAEIASGATSTPSVRI